MQQSKRKKLFYVPGLISLLFLPFIFIHYLPKLPQKEFAMKLFLPKDVSTCKKNQIQVFSQQSFLTSIKSMKKTEIYLDEDIGLNEQKNDFIFHELQRLSFISNNEVLIVHVNDQVDFREIVLLLNLTLIVQLKRYALFNDAFYYVGNGTGTKKPQYVPTLYQL